MLAIDHCLHVTRAPRELRDAAVAAGRRLLEEVAAHAAGRRGLVPAFRDAVLEDRAPGAHAVALGVAGAAFGVPPEDVAAAPLFSTANALVQAAMRLLPISHRDAQSVLHRVRDAIADAARAAAADGTARVHIVPPTPGDRVDAPRERTGPLLRVVTQAIGARSRGMQPRHRGQTMSQPITIGVGGPVGSGTSLLVERIVPPMIERGFSPGVVANDVVTEEDALIIRRGLDGILDPARIVGVATGACPHQAVREDPSLNLAAIERLAEEHPDIDLVFIESGGDNLTLTFSALLARLSIYVMDVAGGDKTPRKRGAGMIQSDLLVINKTDLAPYVGVDVMERDAATYRSGPLLFTDCRHGSGLVEVADWLATSISALAAPAAAPA